MGLYVILDVDPAEVKGKHLPVPEDVALFTDSQEAAKLAREEANECRQPRWVCGLEPIGCYLPRSR